MVDLTSTDKMNVGRVITNWWYKVDDQIYKDDMEEEKTDRSE